MKALDELSCALDSRLSKSTPPRRSVITPTTTPHCPTRHIARTALTPMLPPEEKGEPWQCPAPPLSFSTPREAARPKARELLPEAPGQTPESQCPDGNP